jgi:hypothetical protein
MLQNQAVKRWLGDITPAWTLLNQRSFAALRHPLTAQGSAIRLATDLTPEQIGQSAGCPQRAHSPACCFGRAGPEAHSDRQFVQAGGGRDV